MDILLGIHFHSDDTAKAVVVSMQGLNGQVPHSIDADRTFQSARIHHLFDEDGWRNLSDSSTQTDGNKSLL